MAYVNDTGLPSVTEILRPWIDTTWFTDEAAERGTAVHAAAEAYLKGLYAPQLPEEWEGYLDSAVAWIEKQVADAVVIEDRLIDRQRGFCGKPDLVANMKDGTLALIDFKTSQATYKWWPIQVAAYRSLASASGIHTTRGLCLRLKPDGSGGIVTEYTSFNRDLAVFMSALNAHHYFSNGGKP